jgi:fatty-acyl-CoA synthase
VAEVAVFGVPHPKWIEAVTAVVVAKPGEEVSVEALQDYCRETLSHFKSPKHIALTEALPKNASGKILKRDLRIAYAGVFEGEDA